MKKIIIAICLAACSLTLQAQNMAEVFIAMPNEYLPQLEDAWRKDLVDLYRSGEKARLKNDMGGTSELVKLTEDYLLLQSTERTTVEMKLLPLVNNTFVVCRIVTLEGPVKDSRVTFFSPEWEPLNSEDLWTPVRADWFIRTDADTLSVSYGEAISQLNMDLFHYQLNPDDYTLTQIYTTPLYTDRETQKKLKRFLKDSPKVYTWTKTYFK